MRLTVTAGDRQIDIAMKGHSVEQLHAAEETATRLLETVTRRAADEHKPAFGYSATSDTERAPEE